MYPVLKKGDKICVNRLSYGTRIPLLNSHYFGFSKFKRGDVVVFVPPQEAPQPWFKRRQFIKRLIALPGERVMIQNGDIFINGQSVTDPRITNNYYRSDPLYGAHATGGNEILVPEGKYFFLGDNSGNSEDSRRWGFADEQWLIGKALFIWWPPQRIGAIH